MTPDQEEIIRKLISDLMDRQVNPDFDKDHYLELSLQVIQLLCVELRVEIGNREGVEYVCEHLRSENARLLAIAQEYEEHKESWHQAHELLQSQRGLFDIRIELDPDDDEDELIEPDGPARSITELAEHLENTTIPVGEDADIDFDPGDYPLADPMQYRVQTYSNGRGISVHMIEYSEDGSDWYSLFEDPSLEVCEAVSKFLSTQTFENIRGPIEDLNPEFSDQTKLDCVDSDPLTINNRLSRAIACAAGGSFFGDIIGSTAAFFPAVLTLSLMGGIIGGTFGFFDGWQE